MSLLPCTSHRDPDHPFWATTSGGGGGGVVPINFTATPTPVSYTSTERETLFTIAVPTPATDGIYVCNVFFNVATGGTTNEFKFWVTDTANLIEALTICDSVSPANYTNTSLAFTTFYVNGTTIAPVITFDTQATTLTGDPIVSYSYNLIFYPYVFPPP